MSKNCKIESFNLFLLLTCKIAHERRITKEDILKRKNGSAYLL